MQVKRERERTARNYLDVERKRQRTILHYFSKLSVNQRMSFPEKAIADQQLHTNECEDVQLEKFETKSHRGAESGVTNQPLHTNECLGKIKLEKFENKCHHEIENKTSSCSETSNSQQLARFGKKEHFLYRFPIKMNEIPSPFPEQFKDMWDSKIHVKMPCSSSNQVILVKTIEGKRTQVRLQKWEVITNHLMSKHLTTSSDLVTAMKAYNPVMADDDFIVLYCLIDECLDYSERRKFFETLLPKMIRLALKLPDIVTQSVPLLKQKENKTLHISQEQIGCLLANAFFCAFPKRSQYKNLPEINFRSLFSHAAGKTLVTKTEKLKCILNYFRRILEETPKGVVSFERRFLNTNAMPEWPNSQKPLRRLQVFSEGLIEEQGNGMLQVDFANKLIGGGVLGSGCVQEEIRFVINPELIVARLFTEQLLDNEVLIVTGTEQFSRYSGYSDSFRFKSDFVDKTPLDNSSRRCTKIVALDALYFGFTEREKQYKPECINRELNKAYTAFAENRETERSPIATGNWGCGAFNGDPQLKAILQLLAASESERDIVYFTFNDDHFKSKIDELFDVLQLNQHTVGSLYSKITNFWKARNINPGIEVIDYIANGL